MFSLKLVCVLYVVCDKLSDCLGMTRCRSAVLPLANIEGILPSAILARAASQPSSSHHHHHNPPGVFDEVD